MTMTPTPSRIDLPAGEPAPREATFLDVAAVLLRRWKLVAGATLAGMLLFGVLAFTLPRSWTARVVLVPSSGGGDRLQMLASQLAIPALAGRFGGNNAGQSVAAIVKSRALLDSVSVHVRSRRQTTLGPRPLARLLRRGTRVGTDPISRSITIDVTTHDRGLSQRLAAAFPEAVNAIATSIALDAAAHKRETLERQIEVARENLRRSQQALVSYQERTGTPQIQEQARQTVAASAELQRAITAQELRVAQLRRVATPDNPAYTSAVAQLETLRGQLRRMSREGSDVFLSRGALPAMQVELANRMRDFTKDEQIYTMLTADLVDNQLDLSDNLEVVSVLEAPGLPELPSGPHKALLLVLGTLLGGMAGVLWALIGDFLARARTARPDEPFFVEWERFRRRRAAAPATASNGRHAGVS